MISNPPPGTRRRSSVATRKGRFTDFGLRQTPQRRHHRRQPLPHVAFRLMRLVEMYQRESDTQPDCPTHRPGVAFPPLWLVVDVRLAYSVVAPRNSINRWRFSDHRIQFGLCSWRLTCVWRGLHSSGREPRDHCEFGNYRTYSGRAKPSYILSAAERFQRRTGDE